jgi:hypothetical protein
MVYKYGLWLSVSSAALRFMANKLARHSLMY